MKRMTDGRCRRIAAFCALGLSLVWLAPAGTVGAQQPGTQVKAPVAAPSTAVPSGPSSEAAGDYVIGPTDVLTIVISEDKDTTSEVTVRPDGKITLPLINDVVAAGLTPEQLRRRITDLEKRFVQMPAVTVVVKQVNNNRAFVTGQVLKPGPYVLAGQTTILQLLAMAGGFTEFADREHVLISRMENGVQRAFTFNYNRVVKKQDLSQNLVLKAGDTIVVP